MTALNTFFGLNDLRGTLLIRFINPMRTKIIANPTAYAELIINDWIPSLTHAWLLLSTDF